MNLKYGLFIKMKMAIVTKHLIFNKMIKYILRHFLNHVSRCTLTINLQ